MQNLKSFFQSAATVLAPPIENDYDEFYQAWCAIKDYYGETKMDKIAVQNSMIPDQLAILIEKLRHERHQAGMFDSDDDQYDDEGYDESAESTDKTRRTSSAQASMRVGVAANTAEVSNSRLPPSGPIDGIKGLGGGVSAHRGDATPCLEYMLNHVFSTLCVLGQGDTPVGMKEEVLQFLTTFLKDNAFGIHADIRARRMSAHGNPADESPVVRQSDLMNTNVVLTHAKVPGPLMDLIKSCHKPKMSLYEEDVANILSVLAHLLRDNPTCVPYFIDRITEENKSHVESLGYGDGESEFFILDALTDLLSSEDIQVVNRACESILALVACDSPEISKYITSSKRLTILLMDHLSSAFNALPAVRGASEQDRKRLIRSLDGFKAWATYVDRVFCKSVGLDDHLSEFLHSNFFVPCLEKKLRETPAVSQFKSIDTTRQLSNLTPSQDVVEFYEGDFLRMLLQKMQRMLDEPYGEMLRVSALLSHLATFPNEQLRTFLLSPKCEVPPSVLTLYHSLEIATILLDEFVKEIGSCCMVSNESSV
ncbi:hypothetical protein SARC_04158 [Sphaeroforma arctica JP610]|uniref:FHF complex subunit HOOK-interacting protein C-terminal domain-containing protein n=1 Tax=Sphaeroforma arctica JP610 TaxID=667725 RepID=A0A0L0G3H6_9EUKA|nr:hypothetical protein SARC_04158 [Sphaeroforma arctica JP610]KNC83600.1 hypothetical protein SARC_04158 [Sphaeroforma arctica JP610]|eukprot:XP_014157502.1 hypothetical protein SARC_04158 [Sphaeroforma arctica JP610]